MSIASHAVAEVAIGDARNSAAPSKTPPKRRTTALADTQLAPEPR